MSDLDARARIELTATLTLSEAELRALARLSRFALEAIAKCLAESLSGDFGPRGEHAAGLRSLLEEVRAASPAIIRRADQARAAFHKDPP